MRKSYLLILLIATLLDSCSTDEPRPSVEQPNGQTTEHTNVYFEFNQWVYSQMNHYYLWREDLPDSLSCDYELAPREFFQSVLSPKDRFSYFTNNPYYRPTTEQANYGFEYQQYSDAKGNKYYHILYVHKGSDASKLLKRGDLIKILQISPAELYGRKIASYNGNLIVGAEIQLSSTGGVTQKSVYTDSIYSISNKKIGYLCYLNYEGTDELSQPLERFKQANIDELIIDLRYNPGGYLSTCKYLCNSIVPSTYYGEVFQKCIYNDKVSAENIRKYGTPYTLDNFDYAPTDNRPHLGTVIQPLNLKRIFVLTSKHTASASEATIVCLNPYIDVITIGEQTVGKGVGSWTIYSGEYQYAIQPITMRYYNANDETTPDEGIPPDYYVPDGYSTLKNDLGDINEPLLNMALQLILQDALAIPNPLKSDGFNVEQNYLTPIGEPSYITTFKQKYHQYEN